MLSKAGSLSHAQCLDANTGFRWCKGRNTTVCGVLRSRQGWYIRYSKILMSLLNTRQQSAIRRRLMEALHTMSLQQSFWSHLEEATRVSGTKGWQRKLPLCCKFPFPPLTDTTPHKLATSKDRARGRCLWADDSAKGTRNRWVRSPLKRQRFVNTEHLQDHMRWGGVGGLSHPPLPTIVSESVSRTHEKPFTPNVTKD